MRNRKTQRRSSDIILSKILMIGLPF